ncbi:hypothetical protein [Cellulomonas sp. URHE0023]|uniref:hypothetical protein n=1 Tax=Cellulomonas sp. URHE0023 TaxID=1380354 RepID=UPI000487A2BA|nr:hypothetical protein [Cellulomonas sp. URHE0023]
MTILSNAPVDRYAAELQTFGHFAGAWRTHIRYLGPDGSPVREVIGDWEFSYALDGRAVVDTWRVPARDIACVDAEREVGLCVRIWDPRLQLWRFTFHSTATTTVIHMYAHRIGPDIVLERAEADRIERWVFSDIQADTFAWRNEISRDGGSWQTVQTVDARRTTPPTT